MADDYRRRHVPPQPFTWWTSEIFRERAMEDMSEEGREQYHEQSDITQKRQEVERE